MPFGMGPAGWFLWPWFAQWFSYYWYPWWYRMPYWFPYSPLTKEQEISMLEDQARILQGQLDQINARLKELQKTK